MRIVIQKLSAFAVLRSIAAAIFVGTITWHSRGWTAETPPRTIEIPVAVGANAMGKMARTTSSESAIKEGNSAFEDERYELSAAWFDRAIQLDPKSSEAFVLRGKARVKINLENLAARDFDEAIRLNPKSKDAWRWRGSLQLSTMEYEQALGNVNEALRLDPSFAMAYNTRAWAHHFLGKTNAALEDLASALRLSPELIIAQKSLETLTRNYSDPEKLVEVYTNLARSNPGTADRYYLLAAEYRLSMQDVVAAFDLLSEAIRLDPKKTIYRDKRAYCLIVLGKHDAALEDLEAALKIDPKDPWAYNNRGYLYQTLGSTDRALADFTKSIEVDPHYPTPYDNLKAIYRALGQPEGIMRELETAARLNTNAAAVYYYEGGIHYRFLQRFKDSIEPLSKAIRLDPTDTAAIHERGRSYWALRQYDLALKDFDEEIRLDSTISVAHLNRGGVLAAMGKVPEAIAEYKLAMRADPSYAEPHSYLRNIRAKQDPSVLLNDYTELLRIHPEGATQYFLERAKVHLQLQHYAEAISDLTAVVERQPLNNQAYLERSRARRFSGDYPGAMKDAQRTLVAQPAFGRSMVEIALNLQLLGRNQEALDKMTEAVKLNPNSSHFRISRAMLEADLGQFKDALSDFNAAIVMEKVPYYFYHRSRLNLILGLASAAADDACEYLRLQGWRTPQSAWAVLLGQLGFQQAGQSGKAKGLLEEGRAKLDLATWPNIVIRYLRGEVREEVVMARALDANRLFTAHLYLGLEQLRTGRTAAAIQHLLWVKEHPEKEFALEYNFALAQLSKAGASPTNDPTVRSESGIVAFKPDLNRGLVLHLPLSQDLADHSSNQHPVKVVGRVRIQDGAARFDGGNDYLDLPHIDLAEKPWALSAWVRFTGTNSMYGLIEQKDSDNYDRYLHLMLRGQGQPYLGFYLNDVISPTSLELRGSWHHLIFQYTGLHQQIWVDGRLLCQRVSEPYAGVAGRTAIGRSPKWSGIASKNLEGYLKELRIYDRELAFQEIRSLSAESPLPASSSLTSTTRQGPTQNAIDDSAPALTAAFPPPRPFLSINGNSLTISSPPVQVYDLQATSDLRREWAHLVTLTNLTGQVEFIDTESATVSIRFYRVLVTASTAPTQPTEK